MYILVVLVLLLSTSILDVGKTKLVSAHSLFESRVIGGQSAKIEDYPYQVAVHYHENYRCGGAIISDVWIITAAHCVDGLKTNKVQIRAESSLRGNGGTVHNVTQIIVNPAYNKTNYDSDVALIKVYSPLEYGPAVKAVPIIDREPTAGEIGTVTGWGPTIPGGLLSFDLQVVSVPIVDREECNEDYDDYGGITTNMICAGSEQGGKDACNGDTGSPLVVGGFLTGIVSWGIGCAQPGYPGVYANIIAVKDFISNETGIL